MLGYTQRDNIYRDDPYSGVLPEDCRRISDFIIEHLYDSQPFHLSYQLLTKSGAYIWVTANFNTFQFENTRYLYAVYTDISELKRQEKQLREQYNAAQTYLNSVSGTYIATRRVNLTRGRIESVDGMKPLAVTRGVTDYNEYVSRLLSTVPGRRDREHCRAFYARSAMLAAFGRGERIRSLEYPYRTPDGNITWVRNTVNLTMRPGSGDVIAFSAVSDINREKIIGTIMDKLASTQYDSIGCIDAANGRIVFYSSPDGTLGGKTIIRGCDYEQEMREYCGRFVVASDRETYTASMHLSNVVRLLDAGERCSVTFSAMEGGALRVKLAEFFFVDREYRLIGLVRTDYTDMQRRQLEQEKRLRDALEKARQANAAKSDFLSRMSHDIRTPLNGIIGMTYLTRELALPEKAQENLRKIDISSKFLLSLINDILDLTKAESDKIELYPEPYPPQEFYDYMDAVFKPLCDGKNQTFMVDMHPPVSVIPLFDKLRINQVLFNLLSNAVKYTPEGGTICYRANYTDPDENGRLTAEFEIGDNGRGMSEEFQKHLFESFTQESREDTSEVRGSGLGLAIVKRLMDLMGGSVSVRSRLGAGSTFTIRMEVDSIPLAADSSPQAGERPGGRPALLAGAHVLLCEDHPLNQEIAAALLARRKVDVTVAEDGKAGVERFRKSPPDYYRAILMDIRMPVMNGYEAARAIRALDRPDAKKVPIIAMTADAFLDDVQRCLDAGMNGHIAKPIEPETLYKTLESAIR
jgi:signal transduction histidine kinase/CheY-like chemotaxis protein/PAS domain-containing protein